MIKIHVFYVAPNNTIRASIFEGSWSTSLIHMDSSPADLSMPFKSRALATTAWGSCACMDLMFFESLDGTINVFNGTYKVDIGPDFKAWVWQNITSDYTITTGYGATTARAYEDSREVGIDQEKVENLLSENPPPNYILRSTTSTAEQSGQ